MIVSGVLCLILVLGMLVLHKHILWQKIRSPCMILLVFGILAFLSELLNVTQTDEIALRQIPRNAPGEGDLETEAILYLPEEDTEYQVTLAIEEWTYETAEEQTLLEAAKKEIAKTFCGENTSFNKIVENPNVRKIYQNGAVEAEWIFSDSKVISEDGKIVQQALTEERIQIEALVILSCGKSEEFYEFSFWIWPKKKSKKEQMILAVEKELALLKTTEKVVELPESLNGRKIQWKSVASTQWAEFLGLGVLAAITAVYIAKEQRERRLKKRKHRLLLSYPEFVSKLSLLLGAGMTISNAMQKMNQMYQKRLERGGKAEAVYEELYRMICEMDNGMGVVRAYQEFSERCDLQPYRKLVSLLISGQKVGNHKLMEQLNEEADRVFLERKNAARRLGEEAGTKMLFPMMLMLVIVMGIVIIPAFLSIYGI